MRQTSQTFTAPEMGYAVVLNLVVSAERSISKCLMDLIEGESPQNLEIFLIFSQNNVKAIQFF